LAHSFIKEFFSVEQQIFLQGVCYVIIIIIQYNGAFGCWKCEQEGKAAKVGKGHARIFPYDAVNPKYPNEITVM
jgi:hypothetical protein